MHPEENWTFVGKVSILWEEMESKNRLQALGILHSAITWCLATTQMSPLLLILTLALKVLIRL